MRISDAGMSLQEWADSFLPDDEETENLMAKYAENLLKDNRFKALLNQMEAQAMVIVAKEVSEAGEKEEAESLIRAVRVFRKVLKGRASYAVIASSPVTD